jgi:Tfp pilus assembly PilM family ATPase
MPQKILGLDIGDSAVKAVLVMRSLTGRSRVVAADVIDIAADQGLKEALDQLFAKAVYRDASCVVSLPAKSMSYRNLKLPFRDKKKIEQTLVYELEPMIQSPVDHVYLDYIRSDGPGGSEILAATVEKSFIRERLALLEGYVRHITIIDGDAVACALRWTAQAADGETFIWLDVGMKNTAAVFVGRGKILQMRYFGFGGDFMTDKGARFIAELKNTVEYLVWQGILDQFPSRIGLTGGGALKDGIEEGLAQVFSIPLEKPDILQAASILIDGAVKTHWQAAILNQALVLATRPADEGAGFNFKRRIAEVKRGYDEIKKDLRWIGACALVVAVLGVADSYLDYRYSQSKLEQIKGAVTAEFKQHMPETTRIVEPLSQLKVGIAEAKKITAGLQATQTDIKILDMLKDVSGLAPASTELTIRSFNFENGLISMKGETKNFDSVDAIKKEIGLSKLFKSVTIGATNLMKQGDRVEFELRIETHS